MSYRITTVLCEGRSRPYRNRTNKPSDDPYTLLQCAKANGLEPYAYPRRVFTELPKAQSLADIEALLPTRLNPADLT